MKGSLILTLGLLFFLPFGIVMVKAQSCANIQREARNLYDQGDIDEAMAKIQLCLGDDEVAQEKFLKAESGVKADLFWLASQIYILKKEREKAATSFKNMLSYRPYYQPTEADMQDIAIMRRELWVLPQVALDFRAELINTYINIHRKHKVMTSKNPMNEVGKSYGEINIGAKLGLGVSMNLNKNLRLATGIEVWAQTFDYTYSGQMQSTSYEGDINYATGNGTIGLDTLTKEDYIFDYDYVHTQSMVQAVVPFVLKYNYIKSEAFVPYLEAGIYGGYLMTANRLIESKERDSYIITNVSSQAIITESNLEEDVFDTDTRAIYTKGSAGYILGLGASVTVRKKLYFDIGARYQASFFSHTKQEARFSYEDLLYSFYDLQDDFSLNNLSVVINWRVPLSFRAFDK